MRWTGSEEIDMAVSGLPRAQWVRRFLWVCWTATNFRQGVGGVQDTYGVERLGYGLMFLRIVYLCIIPTRITAVGSP